jgi:hypothetical protein
MPFTCSRKHLSPLHFQLEGLSRQTDPEKPAITARALPSLLNASIFPMLELRRTARACEVGFCQPISWPTHFNLSEAWNWNRCNMHDKEDRPPSRPASAIDAKPSRAAESSRAPYLPPPFSVQHPPELTRAALPRYNGNEESHGFKSFCKSKSNKDVKRRMARR